MRYYSGCRKSVSWLEGVGATEEAHKVTLHELRRTEGVVRWHSAMWCSVDALCRRGPAEARLL